MTNLPVTGNFNITCIFGKKGSLWKAGFHTGLDIVADDKRIFGTGNGVVTHTGYDKFYGNYVVVKIAQTYHWFCHLSKVYVKKNQKVTRGTVLGIMGNTGHSTGEHLHWEIRKQCNCYGQNLNPAIYAGIPNAFGNYNSKNYELNKYSVGNMITISVYDTGADAGEKRLIEVKELSQQLWISKSLLLNNYTECLVVICAVETNRILVEIPNIVQFWVGV